MRTPSAAAVSVGIAVLLLALFTIVPFFQAMELLKTARKAAVIGLRGFFRPISEITRHDKRRFEETQYVSFIL
ncbi:MAG: hypothetical protein C6W57_10850 [Caldibacillus debilis]|nr:hypothetical protein [Bacillaceae bacterium]MBY6274075.1 hypothetical protein [Bacillaceae bacterium]OUM89292.1 MAG: hypothetical protein BAA03_13010 [Caldibacillus debilis]REJ15695.1 MAG: hypothetical protein C6W57_10850 [Caldibacillus debilis]REJ28798.1 MAG: hypothetical protein C6W56_07185 [Caldibacillus debilis]